MTLFVLGIILFFLFTSLWGFYISVKPPKIVSDILPKDLGLDYEDAIIMTEDGVKLSAWFLPSKKENAKTIILLHGYPADKGNILPALSFLAENYNLLFFDFRHLGRSRGKYSTAGAEEVGDLLAVIRYLKSRGINEAGVWGFSMGGAVALMAAPKAPEIKVIVSESSYARLDLMAQELYRLPLLNYPLAWLTGLWAKLFLGIALKDVSPMDSAKNLDVPVLLVHSQNDEVIPFKNALLIQESLKNNGRAEFWFENNLTHGQLGKKYEQRIEEFFKKNL